MKDMEKEIKMQLLEKLMGEMDQYAGSKFSPKSEPKVEVTEVEQKEMPMSEVQDMMKDKMSMSSEEPSMEMEESEDESEDYGDSRLMDKLKALKAKKAMME